MWITDGQTLNVCSTFTSTERVLRAMPGHGFFEIIDSHYQNFERQHIQVIRRLIRHNNTGRRFILYVPATKHPRLHNRRGMEYFAQKRRRPATLSLNRAIVFASSTNPHRPL